MPDDKPTIGRAEVGDVVDNLPVASIRHELAAGNIEAVPNHPGFYKVLNGLNYPATRAPSPLPKGQPDDKPSKPAPPKEAP